MNDNQEQNNAAADIKVAFKYLATGLVAVSGFLFFVEANIEKLTNVELFSIYMEPTKFYSAEALPSVRGRDALRAVSEWDVYVQNFGNEPVQITEYQVAQTFPESKGASQTIADEIYSKTGEPLDLPFEVSEGKTVLLRANITINIPHIPREVVNWATEKRATIEDVERHLMAEYDRTLFGGGLMYKNKNESRYSAGHIPNGSVRLTTSRCNTYSSSNHLMGTLMRGIIRTKLTYSCYQATEVIYAIREWFITAWLTMTNRVGPM